MEDTTATKEVTSQGTPVFYPRTFHEVIRAVLRCLGLESGFQQNPNSCPKKEDDGKVNHNQLGSQKESSDPPSTTDYSDPPSTVIDPAADPPSTTGDNDDNGVLVVSFFTPRRPGTGGGRGPQIN